MNTRHGTGDMWIHDFPYCCGRRKVNPMAITASSLYKAFLQGTRK